MRLLIDLGNSRLKWALSARGIWRPGRALSVDDSFTNALTELWQDLETPNKIVIASVASADRTRHLQDWLTRRWTVTPDIVVAQRKGLGVTNNYAKPETLGSDRWAALIAAYHAGYAPACLVDCGTAVTVDALSVTGEFLGGAIFPGLQLLRDSLTAGTAIIEPEEGGDTSCQGISTADGVVAGTVFGLAGAVERLVNEHERVLGEAMQILVTGGDASSLIPKFTRPTSLVPDLVLQGLALLAEV